MRISDWSSDVCSSDLLGKGEHHEDPALLILRRRQPFLQLQRDPPACAIEPFDDAALQIAVAVERVDGSGGDLQERVEESSRNDRVLLDPGIIRREGTSSAEDICQPPGMYKADTPLKQAQPSHSIPPP